jgi:hypothetical protein
MAIAKTGRIPAASTKWPLFARMRKIEFSALMNCRTSIKVRIQS